MVIAIMGFVIVVLFIFIIMLYSMVGGLSKQITLLDKEQHVQNGDIYKIMKENYELKGMILQHVDILKYLVEQDPTLGKKVMYTGPIGEA
jgi:hypothetical protein